MADPQLVLTERFAQALVEAFGREHAGTDPLIRPAQHPRFGEYQANVAMGLAKKVGLSPRSVATAIVEHLEVGDICEPPEVAGPGFVNLRLTARYLSDETGKLATDPRLGVDATELPELVVVDYSSPNVAKEMHVGHLRSTIIGDALARILEFVGHRVIRQNHLGDWGTQFGMLIEHLMDQGSHGGAPDAGRIGDFNDLYRQAAERFAAEPAFAERSRARVVALQRGEERSLAVWRALVEESKRHFRGVYRRLGVGLTDADMRSESFYNPLLDEVADELDAAGLTTVDQGALCIFLPSFASRNGEPLPLIVRKSDGGYPYAATDLAAVRFRLMELEARRIIYVTDARQSQHFAMLFKAAELAGWLTGGVRVEHVSFGSILGEDGRPFRTRSGETVRLADLLEEAVRRARDVVAAKSPGLDPDAAARVAAAVGIGAVKFADLASDRTKDYVFSWERMLAMDGNTAPYLQYAYARVRSILRKADSSCFQHGRPVVPAEGISIERPAERTLVLKMLRFPGVVQAVEETLEPHRLCAWLFELATAFSTFYERCPVLSAEQEQQRRSRLVLCDLTARLLERGLGLLGIDVLEQM